MSDATIFVSLAIFVVYAQRKGRWTLFWHALSGADTIQPLATS